MKIWISPYTLTPLKPLNAVSGSLKVRDGCILKVEYPDSSVGYADLHPWPELGDVPLSQQLERLRYNVETPLTKNSLEIARLDAQARARTESLWLDQEVPENHYLLTEIPENLEDDAELCAAFAQGYDKVKIKVGRDFKREAFWLNHICGNFDLNAQIRLDFNGALNEKSYLEFQNILEERTSKAIDFIEDPMPWSKSFGFGSSRLPLALDRDVEKLASNKTSELSPDFFVIKPAINDTTKILDLALKRNRPVVFTSYLDHPLGQISAMLIATRAQSFIKVETCGLASHLAYEPNDFSEKLMMKGCKMSPPEGLGLGWDEELSRLKWTSL